MIYLLHGENLFQRDLELAKIASKQQVEHYLGDEVDESKLADIFTGNTLFDEKRVTIIDGLSVNKSMWGLLPDWLGKLSATNTLVLIEARLDKRTKAYKLLQKQAKVIDCIPWKDYQSQQAEKWLVDFSRQQKVKLTDNQINQLVSRAIRPGLDDKPMIDQALLATVVRQLSYASEINDEVIDTVIASQSHDNVFGLLEASLSGDKERLNTMLERLKHSQDGHRVLALLNSQAIQLAALVLAKQSGVAGLSQVAKDIEASPYSLQQLEVLASQLDTDGVRLAVERMAWADERLKRGAKPWQLIESTLRSLSV